MRKILIKCYENGSSKIIKSAAIYKNESSKVAIFIEFPVSQNYSLTSFFVKLVAVDAHGHKMKTEQFGLEVNNVVKIILTQEFTGYSFLQLTPLVLADGNVREFWQTQELLIKPA